MQRVLVIGTGGTISAEEKKVSGKKLWMSGSYPVEYIVSIPELEEIANIETSDLFQMASTDMESEHWVKIAEAVYKELPKYSGIVITHGTDTMQYTGAALSFMIQNLNKPVVITGAQTASSIIGSDAKRNMLDSVTVAAKSDIAEMCIVFNGKIMRANRTKKFYESGFNAFDSVDDLIGQVEPNIRLSGLYKKKNNQKPVLDTKINSKVHFLKIYPGMKPSIISKVASQGYKGLVIEAYGAGNLPRKDNEFFPRIKVLVDVGIPVVITTQCIIGNPFLAKYESTQEAEEVGAINCQDMLSETALVKLMWVLGHAKKMEKIREMMRTNYAGEITKESHKDN